MHCSNAREVERCFDWWRVQHCTEVRLSLKICSQTEPRTVAVISCTLFTTLCNRYGCKLGGLGYWETNFAFLHIHSFSRERLCVGTQKERAAGCVVFLVNVVQHEQKTPSALVERRSEQHLLLNRVSDVFVCEMDQTGSFSIHKES